MKFWFKTSSLLIYLIIVQTTAQELNRKSLISKYKVEKETSFVLNGVPSLPSDSVKLDEDLSKIPPSNISNIEVVKKNGENYSLRSDFIIINYATQLPKKLIRKKFKEIKDKFKDKYINRSQPIFSNARDPVLLINGKTINPTESKLTLKKLSKSEIAYIYFSAESVGKKYDDSNNTSGTVIIWTKEKLKE